MFKLDLDEKKKYSITLPELPGVVFVCVPLTVPENERLLKKHTKYIAKRGQQREDVQYSELGAERFVRTVVDWEGVADQDGNLLECNEAHKRKMYAVHGGGYCQDILELVEEQVKRAAEDAVGN